MHAWVAGYEAENGEITEEMMDAADRELRARAVTVTFPEDEPLPDAPAENVGRLAQRFDRDVDS